MRYRLLAAAGIAAALGVQVWLALREPPETSVAAQTRSGGGMAFFAATRANAQGLPAPDDRAQRRRALVEQVQLADHTYCHYRDSTRYPNNSRPIAEQPDQIYPNQHVTGSGIMRMDDGSVDEHVQIQTSQSRVYLAAGESAAFSIRAVDSAGVPLPLTITRAIARGITYGGARPAAQVTIPFADDGLGADAQAGDGAFAGVLAPAQSALAGFNGTIRTVVSYHVNGRAASVSFDVIYSPDTPAIWNGPVREAVESGSLNFYLKADVRVAGRYVVTGRLDDAKGQPFAYVSFNDLLPAGPNDIKLTAFGKLLRDQQPALPLTLRDVEGYLLKENVDPDRALMPRLEGKVFTSRTRSSKELSDAEWQSEERSRHLTEFGKDLQLARAELARFDPKEAVPTECK